MNRKVYDARFCCAITVMLTSMWAFCVFWEFGTDPLLAFASWVLIEGAVTLFGIREHGREQMARKPAVRSRTAEHGSFDEPVPHERSNAGETPAAA